MFRLAIIKLTAVAVGLLFSFLLQGQDAIAADCNGDLSQTHRLGSYDFITNSHQSLFDDKTYKYNTCVKNIGKNDLWIYWYVPGPRSWVPSDEIAESPRFSDDGHSRIMTSCLEYGNLAEKEFGQFLGTEDDSVGVQDEKRMGCRLAAEIYNPDRKGSLIEKLYTPLRLFFPSDLTKSSQSMLDLSGSIYLQRVGDFAYRSSFFYEIVRYNKRDGGNPADVRIRPVFTGTGRNLYSSFEEKNGSSLVTMSSKGTIEFDYQISGDGHLSSGQYEIVDKQSRVLANFDFPIFVQRFNK